MVLSFHCQQISEHNTLMCAKREMEGEPGSENARRFQDPHGTRQAEKEAKIKKMEVQRLGKCRKAELDAVPSDDEQSISARLAIA